MNANSIFTELSLIIVIGSLVSLIMRLIRQPLIVGHILTGVIGGPILFNVIKSDQGLSLLSSLGVSLLLFVVGLEISIKTLSRLSKVVLVTSAIQIPIVAIVSAIIARAMDFGRFESAIIGLCLALSSTVIIVTFFQQKKDVTRLYAQIAIGVLILQDLIATGGKITLSAYSNGETSLEVGLLILRGVAFIVAVYIFSRLVFSRLTKVLESSKELMLIVSLGWLLGIAVLCADIGFSIEVGSLVAGMSLAGLAFSQSMAAQLKAMRDFFIIIFLVNLGFSLAPVGVNNITGTVAVFTTMVLFIKPLITIIVLGLQGYTKRSSFKAAISMSQVSEFSLVFIMAAVTSGYVSERALASVSLTALITFIVSAYFIKYDDWLFSKVEKYLKFFERRVTKLEQKNAMQSYPIIIFGYRKGGSEFIRTFKSMQQRFVVVDYDPDAIELIERHRVNYIYGDATDIEFIDELQLDKCKLVVSTISDPAANDFLAHWLKEKNPNALFIGSADNADSATQLYSEGAAYVMMPHLIGSEKISNFIKRVGINKSEFLKFREKHLRYIENRLIAD